MVRWRGEAQGLFPPPTVRNKTGDRTAAEVLANVAPNGRCGGGPSALAEPESPQEPEREALREGSAMSASHGLSSRWVSGLPGQRSQQVRYAATGAAALAALLYVLAGTVGSIKLGFCLAMGGIFAAVAILLFFFGQRWVWNLVALLDLGAIVGYFAVAPTREPHFEIWGIAIKASQVVLLAALGYLITRYRRAPGHG